MNKLTKDGDIMKEVIVKEEEMKIINEDQAEPLMKE